MLVKGDTKKFDLFFVFQEFTSEPKSWSIVVLFFCIEIKAPSFVRIETNSPIFTALSKTILVTQRKNNRECTIRSESQHNMIESGYGMNFKKCRIRYITVGPVKHNLP